jgi:hypothetical protein
MNDLSFKDFINYCIDQHIEIAIKNFKLTIGDYEEDEVMEILYYINQDLDKVITQSPIYNILFEF